MLNLFYDQLLFFKIKAELNKIQNKFFNKENSDKHTFKKVNSMSFTFSFLFFKSQYPMTYLKKQINIKVTSKDNKFVKY